MRGSGPLGARHTAALARLAETHRLARLTRHGELIVQRIAPAVRMGKATVALPPGAFLQATAEGEAVLARLVSEHVGKAKALRTCSAASDPSRCGSPSARGLRPPTPTRGRSTRSAKRQKRPASSRLPPKRAICSAARSRLMSSNPSTRSCSIRRVRARRRRRASLLRHAFRWLSRCPAMPRRSPASANPQDGGYRLTSVTPVDQFRYSAHVEIVGRFER